MSWHYDADGWIVEDTDYDALEEAEWERGDYENDFDR